MKAFLLNITILLLVCASALLWLGLARFATEQPATGTLCLVGVIYLGMAAAFFGEEWRNRKGDD